MHQNTHLHQESASRPYDGKPSGPSKENKLTTLEPAGRNECRYSELDWGNMFRRFFSGKEQDQAEETKTILIPVQCPSCQENFHISVDGLSPEAEQDDRSYFEIGTFDGWDEDGDYRKWNVHREETKLYFQTLDDYQRTLWGSNFVESIPLIKANVEQIPALVAANRKIDQRVPPSIPALDDGARVLAWAGDTVGLARMREMVDSIDELKSHSNTLKRHEADVTLFQSIQLAVRENPGCEQVQVKILISEPDGRRVASLISFLEKTGDIKRTRDGKKIHLHPPGEAAG